MLIPFFFALYLHSEIVMSYLTNFKTHSHGKDILNQEKQDDVRQTLFYV